MSTFLKSFWVAPTAPCDTASGCSSSLLAAAEAQLTLTSGLSVLVNPAQTALYIGGWRVVTPLDMQCLNGVIHTVTLDVGPPPADDITGAASRPIALGLLTWSLVLVLARIY